MQPTAVMPGAESDHGGVTVWFDLPLRDSELGGVDTGRSGTIDPIFRHGHSRVGGEGIDSQRASNCGRRARAVR